MFKIPDEFRDTPEAAKVREATARFEAVEEVAKHFPPAQHEQVRELLDRDCGRTIPFRREATAEQLEWTRLAVLRLSKGDFSELGKWVELANIDERDVVHAGRPLMKGYHDT